MNNDQLLNAYTRHAVHMERYSTGAIKRILKLVREAEDEIVARMQKDLAGVEQGNFDLNPEENRRVKDLLKRLREIAAAANVEIRKRLVSDAVDMGQAEAEFTAQLYSRHDEITMELGVPSVERIRAIVTAQPFQGKVLRDWAAGLEQGLVSRLRVAINLGLAQGETASMIVSRVRGTKALNYSDGVMAITERGAASLVRTVANHVQVRTHEATIALSPEVFEGVQWVAVLDSHTTAICRARDGTVYPVDKGPRPPAHWGCRSRVVALVKGAPKLNIKSYDEWLKAQPRRVVEDILGKAKARLYLEGGVPLKGFVSRAGEELTLDELRNRDADLFKELGL